MKCTRVAVAVLAATFMVAPRAHAQRAEVPVPVSDVPSYSATSVAARGGLGPTMEAAAIAPRLALSEKENAALAAQRRPFGTSQTLMIVGGAAFVVGAIVGDDAGAVLMVAGAGVGLYGLYLYLRQPPDAHSRAIGVGYSLEMSP